VSYLFRRCAASAGYEVTVDLEAREVRDAAGFRAGFEIEDYQREMLLQGLDEIGRTLLDESLIADYERKRSILSVTKA